MDVLALVVALAQPEVGAGQARQVLHIDVGLAQGPVVAVARQALVVLLAFVPGSVTVGLFLSLLAIAILYMGVYPKPFTDVMDVSVAELLKHVAITKLN